MFDFQPVAFPPSDVPLEYVRHKLQREAQEFWGNTETSDCTITIPLPLSDGEYVRLSLANQGDDSSPFGPFTTQHTRSASKRRATQPLLNDWPRVTLHLHSIFLLSSSSFLRGLLSGASPLDLIHTTAQVGDHGSSRLFTGQFAHPINHIPRLLPCSPNHPSIYLPVPDPHSFHAILHWIYWGKLEYIEECLHGGRIQWEGVYKNAEYLGLPTELKIFLARWRHLWLCQDQDVNMSDDDSDTVYSDCDDDTASTASDSDASWDMDEKQPTRGRPTATRPLFFQSTCARSA
ncbi:hypothetical protein AMATHDRAFT_72745 [Amanita thiersii Skay4041]|uniref:BTB domain-containing protein n=1 Tax=Amanita thiersii Skay4041 TaxID=703135 RepID=A0A2A9P0W6_9AGAR|nr:hypothetical protein AMATHDRAFT_72745 [Amanita thiersii Skay4041]